jgi:protein gp37
MAENSKIEWCDHTFNPWMGCTKVSPGCAHCYAETATPIRTMGIGWGKGQPRKRTSEGNWKQPLKWNKDAEAVSLHVELCRNAGIDPVAEWFRQTDETTMPPAQPRVFCASLADWLDPEVPVEWLADLLELIRMTPYLDWLLLTKRPELWESRMRAVCMSDLCKMRPGLLNWVCAWSVSPDAGYSREAPYNVWVGTTVEDQQRADQRIPELLKIPAKVRFLSCEPLLGQVNLWGHDIDECPTYFDGCNCQDGIHWVICGGESGPQARGMDIRWAESIRQQCANAGVAFFMKQLGAKPYTSPEHESATGYEVSISDKKGAKMEDWPHCLCVRQLPNP